VFADDGMIHLYAQSIGLGVRMVRIEFSLRRFVGPDTADVGFQQQIFPLGSAATAKILAISVIRASSLACRVSRVAEAAIGQQVRPLHRAAECLPLVLEQASEEYPTFRQR
jgi:hypothetical protein